MICSTVAVMASVTEAFLILYFVITVDIPMVQSTELKRTSGRTRRSPTQKDAVKMTLT